MAEIDIRNLQNEVVGKLELSDEVFKAELNEPLIWEAVRHYADSLRTGTAATKTRAQVSGSGKKLWRQKGTGRARAGMTSSPLWRGGGRIFPNTAEENYTHKVNKKMYRAGLCSILSQLVRDDRLAVIEDMAVEAPKTKLLAQKIKAMGFDSVLLITDNLDENLLLASRNLPNVLIVEPRYADPVSLVHYRKVLITKPALARVQEMLA